MELKKVFIRGVEIRSWSEKYNYYDIGSNYAKQNSYIF